MSATVLGSLLPTGIPGVRRWVFASALSVAAMILFSFQRSGPLVLTVVASNELLWVAELIILQGCRQFFAMKPARWYEYASCAVLLAAIVYWTYVEVDVNIRIVLMSLFNAYIYLMVSWISYSRRPADRPQYAYRFVTIAAFLGGFGHFVRGAVYAAGWVVQTELLQDLPINVMFLGLGILALPALSMGMVMLTHDRLAQKLEHMANMDELTATLTRRAFMAQAEAALKSARRTGRHLSIAILDIDHFKSINDAYGHATGDLVLSHFTGVVAKNLRASDIFGRLGGEEFAIVCQETTRGDALQLLNRLQSKIAESPCPLRNSSVAATFSAGVDEYRPGDTLANLMARADSALYVSKARGRDRVTLAEALNDDESRVYGT